MAREGRPLFKIIFQNFINSFRIRQIKGNLKGEDHLGNKYFEIPADASRGKSKRSRWFEPPGEKSMNDPDDHGHELSAEWESWLRGRRKEPPTNEELKKNLAMMHMKKKNADLLDEKHLQSKAQSHDQLALQRNDASGRAEFPKYENEYEQMPGAEEKKK